MTERYQLTRLRIGHMIGSAVGSCDVYAESEDDARAQAADKFGEEWLDPDMVTCRKFTDLLPDKAVPPGIVSES